jgi:hypothetical protein
MVCADATPSPDEPPEAPSFRLCRADTIEQLTTRASGVDKWCDPMAHTAIRLPPTVRRIHSGPSTGTRCGPRPVMATARRCSSSLVGTLTRTTCLPLARLRCNACSPSSSEATVGEMGVEAPRGWHKHNDYHRAAAPTQTLITASQKHAVLDCCARGASASDPTLSSPWVAVAAAVMLSAVVVSLLAAHASSDTHERCVDERGTRSGWMFRGQTHRRHLPLVPVSESIST